jgi:hypothetical protein
MAEADTGGAHSAVSRQHLVAALRRDFSLGERVDWRSHDPYDLLLSPFARRIPQISPLAARVFVQLGRRSGANIRRLLRVPLHEEPKTLADFLRAAVILGNLGDGWSVEHISRLSRRLRDRAVATPTGHAWGNAFPQASRFVAAPADEPNIYTTTAACDALLAEYEFVGGEESLEAASLGATFILRDLGTFTHEGRHWLRYFRGRDSPIVNVQASAASLFARLGRIQSNEELLETADRAAETVVSAQRDDGSWSYSTDGRGEFVDGFHTGFTLQGLVEYGTLRDSSAAVRIDETVETGFAYFKEHLLTPDGRPCAFADGAASRDAQTLAQAIQSLVICGTGPDTSLAARIWRAAEDALQRERFLALRWNHAPFALATANLVAAVAAS